MPNKIGTPTIYGNILPNFYNLMKIYDKPLSKEAKHRLAVLDYLNNKANGNVTLTARHFGCPRSYVYKWRNRFNAATGTGKLSALESRSRKPKHTRSVQYTEETVKIIRKIRKEYPTYSAKKIERIMLRDWFIKISSSTIGRIIKKFNMFYSKVIELHKRLSRAAKKGWSKRNDAAKRKETLEYHKKALYPCHIVEFDMKHINNGGNGKQYALCAIDPFTKDPLIHICSTPSSHNAKIAMEKVVAKYGKTVIVINDNGSENFGEMYDYLASQDMVQVFTRPRTPKDKPYIENFIGKYQKECLNESIGIPMTVAERQKDADKWVNDWYYYRPHQSLNYLTPAEYADQYLIISLLWLMAISLG